MPRNPNQLSLPTPRSPAMNNGAMSGFNAYPSQLAVSVGDTAVTGQWDDGEFLVFTNKCFKNDKNKNIKRSKINMKYIKTNVSVKI